MNINFSNRPEVPESINDLSFSKSLVKILTPYLNKLHDTNESNSYWEYLILPHIQIMSERMVDRFISIHEDIAFQGIKVNQKIKDREMTQDPFFWFSQEPENEEFILRKIMEFLARSSQSSDQITLDIKESQNDWKENISNFHLFLLFIKKFKIFIEKYLKYPFKFIYKEIRRIRFYRSESSKVLILRDFLHSETEKTLKNQMDLIQSADLQFYLDGKSAKALSPDEHKIFTNFRGGDLSLSSYLTQIPELNLYIKFLEKNLLSFLPSFCIEEYDYFRSFLKNIRSKYIISDSVVFWDAVSRHIFADQKSKGSKSLVFQHGGGYDLELYNSFEIMEREFSDQFIPWRASNHSPGLISRRSLIKANNKLADKIYSTSVDVLILGTMFKDFHVYNVGHHPVFDRLVVNRVSNLIKSLNDNGISTKYRPYGWKEDIISAAQGIRLGSVTSIHQEILSAKVIICCKATTTVNDCLSVGRYPILFFGDEQTHRNFVQESLEALKKEKFYFDDSQECVEYLTSLSDDCSINPSNATKKIFSELFGENLASSDDIARIIKEFTNSN
jgi:hypothetical protein